MSNEELANKFEILSSAMVEAFDRIFHLVDEFRAELKQDISDLRLETKNNINELKKEMRQGFLNVDNRLSSVENRLSSVENRLTSVENNMVYKHEFIPLIKRVKLLEAK